VKETVLSNLFDQFLGSPIDWDNPENFPLVFQISAKRNPEQMRTEIRASSIDPNELVTIGHRFVEFSSHDQAKVAWEEAIRQLEADPSRIAADVHLVNLKQNVCVACLQSAPLESFQWISRESRIAHNAPMVAIQLVESLQRTNNYKEVEIVLQ